MKIQIARKRFNIVVDNVSGKVGVPILLYFLGMPGIVVVLAWFFFFKD